MNNPVSDLSPLVYLTKLQALDLTHDDVPDLTLVAALADLRSLRIEQATLKLPASLAAFKNVNHYARSTTDDGELIARLTQLTHLELGYVAFINPDALGTWATSVTWTRSIWVSPAPHPSRP